MPLPKIFTEMIAHIILFFIAAPAVVQVCSPHHLLLPRACLLLWQQGSGHISEAPRGLGSWQPPNVQAQLGGLILMHFVGLWRVLLAGTVTRALLHGLWASLNNLCVVESWLESFWTFLV